MTSTPRYFFVYSRSLRAWIAGTSSSRIHSTVQYGASLPAKWHMVTVDMTYPATEKHIRKARKQQYHMVSVA